MTREDRVFTGGIMVGVLATLAALCVVVAAEDILSRPSKPEPVKEDRWRTNSKGLPKDMVAVHLVTGACAGMPGVDGEPDWNKPFHLVCETKRGLRWCDQAVVRVPDAK